MVLMTDTVVVAIEVVREVVVVIEVAGTPHVSEVAVVLLVPVVTSI